MKSLKSPGEEPLVTGIKDALSFLDDQIQRLKDAIAEIEAEKKKPPQPITFCPCGALIDWDDDEAGVCRRCGCEVHA